MKKLFTHTDLDGIGCAVLAKLAFGPEIDISFCTPYTINTEVDSFISNENGAERCHITDISISEDVAEKINQKSVGIRWQGTAISCEYFLQTHLYKARARYILIAGLLLLRRARSRGAYAKGLTAVICAAFLDNYE